MHKRMPEPRGCQPPRGLGTTHDLHPVSHGNPTALRGAHGNRHARPLHTAQIVDRIAHRGRRRHNDPAERPAPRRGPCRRGTSTADRPARLAASVARSTAAMSASGPACCLQLHRTARRQGGGASRRAATPVDASAVRLPSRSHGPSPLERSGPGSWFGIPWTTTVRRTYRHHKARRRRARRTSSLEPPPAGRRPPR